MPKEKKTESLQDFVRKLDEQVRKSNKDVKTSPKEVFVTEENLPELKELGGKQKPETEITSPEIDAKKDHEVKKEGVEDLQSVVNQQYLNSMASKVKTKKGEPVREDLYVREVETPFEGREHMGSMKIYGTDGTHEGDAIYKGQKKETGQEEGVKRRYNDTASEKFAQALGLKVINMETWIPPQEREGKKKVA